MKRELPEERSRNLSLRKNAAHDTSDSNPQFSADFAPELRVVAMVIAASLLSHFQRRAALSCEAVSVMVPARLHAALRSGPLWPSSVRPHRAPDSLARRTVQRGKVEREEREERKKSEKRMTRVKIER